MLPIHRVSICSDEQGNQYRMEISIENSDDSKKYPEGVKAIFKLIRLDINEEGRPELAVLIDNHTPYGFHHHDKLPNDPDSRKSLHFDSWQEAWDIWLAGSDKA